MGTEKVKIAYFIDSIIEGGTELQLVEQINRLEGDEFEQILYCLFKSEEHDSIPIKCRTEILEIRSLAKADTLMKAFEVAFFLRKKNIDIVQTYFFDSTCLGVFCGRLAGVKKVISCRRDLGFWYTRNLLLLLRFCNLFTNHIIVNSESVKRNVVNCERVKNNKIDKIGNGIDLSSYTVIPNVRSEARNALSIKENEVTIGIIANMSRPVKRVDLFVEAAKIILTQGIHVKFFILGDGYLKAELQEKVRSNGLDASICFLGKGFDKHLLLSSLDIAVLTSDSEGFSNAIMEYMASGIPSVVSDVVGNIEMIRSDQNGLLFLKGDAQDLSDKLIELIFDPSKRVEFGRRAAVDILDFDWSRRIVEMKGYYREILKDQRGR
jgi:L-malate glycosyltransferase